MSHNPKTFEEALLKVMREELIEQVIAKPRPYVGRIMETSEANASVNERGITKQNTHKTEELEAAFKQISDRLDKLEAMLEKETLTNIEHQRQ